MKGKKKNRKKKRTTRSASTVRLRLPGKTVRLNRTYIIASITAVAAFLVIATFALNYVPGTYHGLGKSSSVPLSEYRRAGFRTGSDGLLKYSDSRYRSIAGIDVSEFQGSIDWEKVRKAGVDFAMIRLGYSGSATGQISMDTRFRENISGARKAGIEVGVYFFSQAKTTEEAVSEAKYVIRHIRMHGVTYPVAYDMEPVSGSRISGLTKKQKTRIADAFCTIIRRNGYKPMVYGNPSWLSNQIDRSYLTKYGTWLAHYSGTNYTDYSYSYKMWQYSDRGKISGISGKVDLDIYFIKK